MGVPGEPGLALAYAILGKSLPSPDSVDRGLRFPMQYTGQNPLCSFEEPTAPRPYRERVFQASGWHLRPCMPEAVSFGPAGH